MGQAEKDREKRQTVGHAKKDRQRERQRKKTDGRTC